jgi:hypothetical protein
VTPPRKTIPVQRNPFPTPPDSYPRTRPVGHSNSFSRDAWPVSPSPSCRSPSPRVPSPYHDDGDMDDMDVDEDYSGGSPLAAQLEETQQEVCRAVFPSENKSENTYIVFSGKTCASKGMFSKPNIMRWK